MKNKRIIYPKIYHEFLRNLILGVIIISTSFVCNTVYYLYMNANNSVASKVLHINDKIETEPIENIKHVDMVVSKKEAFAYLNSDIIIKDKTYSGEYEFIGINANVMSNLISQEFNLKNNEILIPKKVKIKGNTIDSVNLIGENITFLIPYKHYSHGQNKDIISEIEKYIEVELKVSGVYDENIFNESVDNTLLANNETVLKINTFLNGDFETEIEKLVYNNVVFIDDTENIDSVEEALRNEKIDFNRMLYINSGLLQVIIFLYVFIIIVLCFALKHIPNKTDILKDNTIDFKYILKKTKNIAVIAVPSLIISAVLFSVLLGWEFKITLGIISIFMIYFIIDVLKMV